MPPKQVVLHAEDVPAAVPVYKLLLLQFYRKIIIK